MQNDLTGLNLNSFADKIAVEYDDHYEIITRTFDARRNKLSESTQTIDKDAE